MGFRGSDIDAQTDFGSCSVFSPPLWRSQEGTLCQCHVLSLPLRPWFCTVLRFLWPISLGCPPLFPHAKLGFPICGIYEDRGSLLHFKRNWEASRNLGAVTEGDWIQIQEVTCQWTPFCVCVSVFGRDLRGFIPLVVVGMKKVTWGVVKESLLF